MLVSQHFLWVSATLSVCCSYVTEARDIFLSIHNYVFIYLCRLFNIKPLMLSKHKKRLTGKNPESEEHHAKTWQEHWDAVTWAKYYHCRGTVPRYRTPKLAGKTYNSLSDTAVIHAPAACALRVAYRWKLKTGPNGGRPAIAMRRLAWRASRIHGGTRALRCLPHGL